MNHDLYIHIYKNEYIHIYSHMNDIYIYNIYIYLLRILYMYYIRMFHPGCLGENEGVKLRIHAHCYLINATDDTTIINGNG